MGNGKLCLVNIEFQFYKRNMLGRSVSQKYEYTYSYWTEHLKKVKMINFIMCALLRLKKKLPQVFASVGLGSHSWTSNKFPGNTATARPLIPLWESLLEHEMYHSTPQSSVYMSSTPLGTETILFALYSQVLTNCLLLDNFVFNKSNRQQTKKDKKR